MTSRMETYATRIMVWYTTTVFFSFTLCLLVKETLIAKNSSYLSYFIVKFVKK